MQQHHIPHAPHPPPPAGFPAMSGLVNDFGHVHLGPRGHHFEHNMQQPAFHVIQPPAHGHMPDPRSLPSNGKPTVGYVGYVGYTFTKQPIERVGQKETWAIVNKELMPASQPDLKRQVEKHRKKGVTGLDQYNDPEMKGYKRKQIDELIRECVAMDQDRRFEYVIASIKRDTKRRQSGPETSAMQVVLKRQPRHGVHIQGPFMGFGNLPLPMSGAVDLSGAEEFEKSSQNSFSGHKPGPHPFERHMSEPWVHIGHSDARPPAQHAHSYEHTHPHDLGNAHGHGHSDAGHAHGQEQPLPPHHGHHFLHEDAHEVKHDHDEKAQKHGDKEHKSPKIIHVKKPKSHKLADYFDSSSSSDSDSSSGDTDQTPDTIISSEGSHYHHKDKKYHKSKHHRKSGSHDHGHEPVKVIFREHKRKERRLSPPPPSHRTRYHEDVYVEPAHTHRHRAEPTYLGERFPYHHHHHHRAMSYDDDRLHDHDMRGFARRPTVYRRRITSTAQPIDAYEERAGRHRHEMLDREIWEKEEAARRRERHRRMFHVPHIRMERMHDYHDDHLHDYHDDGF